MATKDDILNGMSPAKGTQAWAEQTQEQEGTPPAKGTQAWAQQAAAQAPTAQAATPSPAAQAAAAKKAANDEYMTLQAGIAADAQDEEKAGRQAAQLAQAAQQQATGTQQAPTGEKKASKYDELIEKFMVKPKTPEELEKEKKKYRRKQIINAISEGISALSNLYFTTQYAPNMYNAKDNSVARAKVSYDKMLSDNKENALAYINFIRNKQKDDDDAARADAAQAYKQYRDQVADERYEAEKEYQEKQDQLTNEREDKKLERQTEKDKADLEIKQEQLAETKRNNNRNYNLNVKKHNDNVEVKKTTAKNAAAKAVRGEPIAFSDGKGSKFAIYEKVWDGSMQQVFDILMEDGVDGGLSSWQIWEFDAKQKDDFVKQNWQKSKRATELMYTLSQIDPANMTSEINKDTLGWGEDNTGEADW